MGRPRSNTHLTSLLAPFSSVDRRLPDNARVDHQIEQREVNGELTLSGIASFLADGVWTIGSAFLSHHIFGPPRKTWGIEMSIFTTFLRNTANYSHLSSITRLRRFLSLGQLFPTSRDGVVTPLTFPVVRRGLRGFLAHADSLEDGTRQLTAEWVVHRKLWLAMQTEYGSNHSTPPEDDANITESSSTTSYSVASQRVILFFHGGAYYVMSSATHRYLTIALSKYANTRIFAVNYRLAPETRFPGPLHDAVSAYFRLIDDLGIPPENIIFCGDSAGGGLCAAALLYLRDEGYPLPSAAILMSPWVDLTMSCASWDDNAPYDYLPQPKADDHLHPVKCYLGDPERVQRYITHPYASPLFGDFTGLPPMLIQNGDAEVLRDEGTLLAYKASLAGVRVWHEVYADCPHVFQAFIFLEASRQALQSCRKFVRNVAPAFNYTSIKISQTQVDTEILKDAQSAKASRLSTAPSSSLSLFKSPSIFGHQASFLTSKIAPPPSEPSTPSESSLQEFDESLKTSHATSLGLEFVETEDDEEVTEMQEEVEETYITTTTESSSIPFPLNSTKNDQILMDEGELSSSSGTVTPVASRRQSSQALSFTPYNTHATTRRTKSSISMVRYDSSYSMNKTSNGRRIQTHFRTKSSSSLFLNNTSMGNPQVVPRSPSSFHHSSKPKSSSTPLSVPHPLNIRTRATSHPDLRAVLSSCQAAYTPKVELDHFFSKPIPTQPTSPIISINNDRSKLLPSQHNNDFPMYNILPPEGSANSFLIAPVPVPHSAPSSISESLPNANSDTVFTNTSSCCPGIGSSLTPGQIIGNTKSRPSSPPQSPTNGTPSQPIPFSPSNLPVSESASPISSSKKVRPSSWSWLPKNWSPSGLKSAIGNSVGDIGSPTRPAALKRFSLPTSPSTSLAFESEEEDEDQFLEFAHGQ